MTPLEDIRDSEIEFDGEYLDHLIEERDSVTGLWPPQMDALEGGILQEGSFLVVSPPGTGKTLLAEMAMVHSWLNRLESAVYLVPYRALAEEKYEKFNSNLGESGFGLQIELAKGFDGPDVEDLNRSQIAVMTYEKFDYYMRNHPGFVDELGTVVVDEFHKIADPNRGPQLEVIVTKILDQFPKADIVGLSATIPNASEISNWISGNHIDRRDWRHNELHEGIFICDEDQIKFFDDGEKIGSERVERRRADINHKENTIIDFLESKTQSSDQQALVFAPKRSSAEKTATSIADYLNDNKRTTPVKLFSDPQTEISEKLDDVPGSSYDNLSFLAKRGVAYHHAGVSTEQKKIIEQGFREGHINVLVATSTLAAGINLPIKRVFILEPRFGGRKGRKLQPYEYQNLAGRAGRPLYSDEFGESVLFANTRQQGRPLINRYIKGEVSPLHSELEIISDLGLFLHLVSEYENPQSLIDFLGETLLGQSGDVDDVEISKGFDQGIQELTTLEMVKSREENNLNLTPVGQSTANKLISPTSVHLVASYLNSVDKIDLADLLIVVVSSPEFDEGNRLWLDKGGGFAERNEIRDRLSIDRLQNENVDNAIATARALEEWMSGTDVDKIYSEAEIDANYWGPADLIDRVAPDAGRVLESVAEVLTEAKPKLAEKYSEELEIIAGRVHHGVPEAELSLIVSGIAQNRDAAMNLRNRLSINSPEEVIEYGLNPLSEKMRHDKAREMYRSAAFYCLDGEERDRELVIADTHEHSFDLDAVTRFLQSDQTDFERNCYNLLDSVDEFRVKDIDDDSGHSADPEFHLRLDGEDGLVRKDDLPLKIGIECKTTKSLEGAVQVEDATAVLRKAGDCDLKVTVGNPEFSDDAIDTANESNILLLPASAMATLVIKLRSSQVHISEVRSIFEETGQLTREDIINDLQ